MSATVWVCCVRFLLPKRYANHRSTYFFSGRLEETVPIFSTYIHMYASKWSRLWISFISSFSNWNQMRSPFTFRPIQNGFVSSPSSSSSSSSSSWSPPCICAIFVVDKYISLDLIILNNNYYEQFLLCNCVRRVSIYVCVRARSLIRSQPISWVEMPQNHIWIMLNYA